MPNRLIVSLVLAGNSSGLEKEVFACDEHLRIETYAGGFKILNEDVSRVEVWIRYGQLLKNGSVVGCKVDIELPGGMYLVRCRNSAGRVLIGKVVI